MPPPTSLRSATSPALRERSKGVRLRRTQFSTNPPSTATGPFRTMGRLTATKHPSKLRAPDLSPPVPSLRLVNGGKTRAIRSPSALRASPPKGRRSVSEANTLGLSPRERRGAKRRREGRTSRDARSHQLPPLPSGLLPQRGEKRSDDDAVLRENQDTASLVQQS